MEEFTSDDSSILQQFFTKNKKPLRKEFISVQIIRSLKRSIRGIKGKLYGFDYKDTDAGRIWNKLLSIIKENPSLNEISLTESGPKTDGKKKKSGESIHKSFNYEFRKSFFKQDAVREYYSYFIELVFHDFTPKALCQKFEISCCNHSSTRQNHSPPCIIKWMSLKDYLTNTQLSELGHTPTKQNSVISLPSVSEILKTFI